MNIQFAGGPKQAVQTKQKQQPKQQHVVKPNVQAQKPAQTDVFFKGCCG